MTEATELADQLKARVSDYFKAKRVLDFCEYNETEARLDLTVANALVALTQENERLKAENERLWAANGASDLQGEIESLKARLKRVETDRY